MYYFYFCFIVFLIMKIPNEIRNQERSSKLIYYYNNFLNIIDAISIHGVIEICFT